MAHAQTAEGDAVQSNSLSTPAEKKHGTIRAVTLKSVIPLIMERYNCDENQALKMFYASHIGECFADDETGLYGQSTLHIFSLFCEMHDENI